MRLAVLIHKPKYGATAMSAETVIRMATTEGAKTPGLDKKIGTIEPGKYTDLVFLKNNELQTIPFENIYSKIVYSTTGRSVKHVLIDGRWYCPGSYLTDV